MQRFVLFVSAIALMTGLYAIDSTADIWALLVGIDDYEDPRITDLNYTVNDVKSLYNALVDPAICGVPKDNVYLMTNTSEGDNRPTNTNVLFRLENLTARIQPDDTFVFHFSGHGIIRGDKQYLLSINADPRSMETLAVSAIPLDNLNNLLKRIDAREILILVDSCRNDPEQGKGDVDNKLTDDLARGFKLNPKYRSDGLPGCTATFFASSVGERAYEWHENRRGVFSYYLVDGLCGGAVNAKGQVTLRSLADYVIRHVVQWSLENLPSDSKQTPWLVSEGAADMILVESLLSRLAVTQTPNGQPDVDRLNGITSKDGALMVLIPAGDFQMGDAFIEGPDNERPVHTVYLDAFYIDKYEVTNEKYANFLNEYGKNTDASGHQLLDVDDSLCKIEKAGNTYRPISSYEVHPVIGVSWYGAKAYAEFYGKRLPTEAEWEKAARGRLVGKRYPWGDEISHNYANYAGTDGEDIWGYTAPIGNFLPNDYGLYDMAGNVWEWCSDWYNDNYYSVSSKSNPTGPENGLYRVLRGGGWDINYADLLRVTFRDFGIPTFTNSDVGFRCAMDVPK